MLFLYVIGFGCPGFCFFISLDEGLGFAFAGATSWNLNRFMNVKYQTYDTPPIRVELCKCIDYTVLFCFNCFCSPVSSSLGYRDVALTLSIAGRVSENWMALSKSALISVTTLTENIPVCQVLKPILNSVFNISPSLISFLKFNAYPTFSPALGIKAILNHSFLFCISIKWSLKSEACFRYCGWTLCNHEWTCSTGQMITN